MTKYSDRNSQSPTALKPLSQSLFEELRDFICEKTGIYFQDNKQYLLQSRLRNRVMQLNFESFEAYFSYLKNPNNISEFTEMVNSITINETYFFRSPEQFSLLQNTLLPLLIEQKKSDARPTIRLWSTACSTGDEPYSIAILVKEHFAHLYPTVKFEIYGSDIDSNILERAQRGFYNAYAIRNIPEHLLRKYFTQNGEVFELNNDIRSLVEFKKINLSDRVEMMRMHHIDLAICANVLIYFPNEIRQKVVMSIYNSLARNGLFLIGFSETLFGIEHPFVQIRDGKNMTYQKAG